MQQILTTFGIDWRLLVINAINFGLLLGLLWYFLYEPLLAMLEKRRRKVAEGVAAAQAAQEELKGIEEKRLATLSEAGKEADGIVSAARASGAAKERELIDRGEAAAATIVRDAERQAAEAKARGLEESKQEVAKLIVLGIEKAMQK